MKKYILNLVLLLFINILISVYLSGIAIFNVVPAIDLILLVVYAVNVKSHEATIVGAMMGLIVDILFGTTFGYNTLMFMYIALGANFAAKNLLSNDVMATLVLTCVAVLLYDSATFLFFEAFNGNAYYFKFLFKIIIPEIIYTALFYFPLQAVVIGYRRMIKKLSW